MSQTGMQSLCPQKKAPFGAFINWSGLEEIKGSYGAFYDDRREFVSE